LFIAGVLNLRRSGNIAVDLVPEHYGVEEDGITPDKENGVEIL